MGVLMEGPVTVADVDVLVDGLLAVVTSLSGDEASQQLVAVRRSQAKLDAYRVALVARIEASQVWREADANATPASFLRTEHVLDHREAAADLRAAAAVDRFPELTRACRDGRVSREKADLILSVGLRNPHRENAFPEFLRVFVQLAEHATTSELRRALSLWADQVDPVTTGVDEHEAHQRRELHVNCVGDGVKVDGWFGKAQGLKLITALNGILDRQWRAANDPERTGHASVPADRIVSTTAAQRADAFIEGIVTPVLESGLVPTCGGAPATVVVTVPLARLQHPTDSADLSELDERMRDGTMRLNSGHLRAPNGPGEALISSGLALELTCDANIQRIVLDPVGKPLDVGRRTRVIPEQIRAALVVRDGGCRFPYCDRPAGWTQAHHVKHWSHGGDTALNNLILLCSKHHHLIHAEHIPIRMNFDGKPEVQLGEQLIEKSGRYRRGMQQRPDSDEP